MATGNMTELDLAEDICENYITPCICGVGIICNTLNLLVLTRKHMTESPYTYLMGLAVADLSVLSLSFFENVFSKRLADGGYYWKIYDGFIFYPLANILTNSSVWITVILTVERFVSVTYPFKAKNICTRSLARRALVAIFLVAVFINIPRFLCQEVVPVDQGNVTAPAIIPPVQYKLQRSPFESGQFYQGVTWFYITLIHVVPSVTLVILNTCLLRVVYRANRLRQDLIHHRKVTIAKDPNCSREQIRLTVTCISIICLFLVCIIPSAVSNRPVAKALFGRGESMAVFIRSRFYRLLRVITNMLVYCNLALNFVLYCVFNYKFMKTLRQLCRRMLGLQGRGQQDGSGTEHARRMDRASSSVTSSSMNDRSNVTSASGTVALITFYHCPVCHNHTLPKTVDYQQPPAVDGETSGLMDGMRCDGGGGQGANLM